PARAWFNCSMLFAILMMASVSIARSSASYVEAPTLTSASSMVLVGRILSRTKRLVSRHFGCFGSCSTSAMRLGSQPEEPGAALFGQLTDTLTLGPDQLLHLRRVHELLHPLPRVAVAAAIVSPATISRATRCLRSSEAISAS